MNFSYWEKSSFLKNIDHLVIGGGIVGLSTAIYLRRSDPKRRVVVAELNPFSAGASSRNAGFACFGSPGELLDDLRNRSEEEVFSLAVRRLEGLKNLRSLLGDRDIGYDPCGGYELFTGNEESDLERCRERIHWLNEELGKHIGGQPYTEIDPAQMNWPFKGIRGGFFNRMEGAIDTGRMLQSLRNLALREGVELFPGLKIDAVRPGGHYEAGGEWFRAGSIAICTNGFARQLLPEVEVTPARNMVVVTEPFPDLSFPGTFHMIQGYVYFRQIHGRLLIGGFRHLDMEQEFTSNHGFSPVIEEAIVSFIRNVVIPDREVHIEHKWSGIMGLGPSKTPVIRKITDGIFAGVRMGGMGVAIGTLVGRELADLMRSSSE